MVRTKVVFMLFFLGSTVFYVALSERMTVQKVQQKSEDKRNFEWENGQLRILYIIRAGEVAIL